MAFLLWEFPITMIAENCMKMKEFWPRASEGGVPAPSPRSANDVYLLEFFSTNRISFIYML